MFYFFMCPISFYNEPQRTFGSRLWVFVLKYDIVRIVAIYDFLVLYAHTYMMKKSSKTKAREEYR